MSSRAKSVSVPNTQTTYPALASPTFDPGIKAKRWLFSADGTAADIYFVNFEQGTGGADHAVFQGGGEPFEFHTRAEKVYVRTSAAGTHNVQITAEDTAW